MAKIVKTKKRKFNLKGVTGAVFLVAVSLSLASSLFLRSYNNSLSVQTQQLESQIATLEAENEGYRVEIQTLSSRDRVTNIAADNGLEMNQDSITTVMVGE
ncbi:MAG: hypothetical protein ACK5LZ_02990 [Anaerorhabdus sp.]